MACCALALLLGIQLVLPSQTTLPDVQSRLPRRTRPVQAPPLPEYAEILNAPVFAPDRKPSVSGGTAQAAASGFTVLGLAAGRGVGAAVLKGPDGATHVARPGDTISGWRLVSMDRNHLVLEREGRRLSVGFDPEHPAPAGPAGAAGENSDTADADQGDSQ
jgi:hypothetical protein